MELKAFLLLFFFIFLSFSNLSAQSISDKSNDIYLEFEDLASNENATEWAILEDVDDKKVYIDFAELGGNFAELVVQDAEGNEVFKEDLFDVPSDSIYELDLSGWRSGAYTLELKTYSKPILRSFSVK